MDTINLTDIRIIALKQKMGMKGIGIYAMLLSLINGQDNGAMRADYETLSVYLGEDADVIRSVVESFGLFVYEDGYITTPEAISNRNAKKAEEARKAEEDEARRATERERKRKYRTSQMSQNVPWDKVGQDGTKWDTMGHDGTQVVTTNNINELQSSKNSGTDWDKVGQEKENKEKEKSPSLSPTTPISTPKEKENKEKEKEDSLSCTSVHSQCEHCLRLSQAYNSIFAGLLASVRTDNIPKARQQATNARVKDYGYETVLEVFKKVRQSNFLCGENDKGWRADYDWIVKASNFQRILEGRYDTRAPARTKTENNRLHFDSQVTYTDTI